MSTTKRNLLEQGRAQHAFQAARVGMKEKTYPKEYLSFVNEMPMLIKTNGLGAAVSFATYKNKASQLVYEQLENWLGKDDPKQLLGSNAGGLVEQLTQMPSTQYRAITVEVMAYLNWLRRFAKGLEKDNV